MFTDTELRQGTILLLGAVIAAVSALARCWSDEKPLSARRLVGEVLSASVAALSLCGILWAYRELSMTAVVGLSGVAGFGGGDLLKWAIKLFKSWGEKKVQNA